jgi:hypothetical protein
VWAFIESGNRTKDSAALAQLRSAQVPVVSIARTDPLEAITIAMLMHSEPDLFEYLEEPIVFPVYGRGRALYSLVGRGIIPDNINDARSFLEGPCACEIKMQNPGTDLLMGADWNDVYTLFPEIEDEPIPPLSGVFAERAPTATALAAEMTTGTAVRTDGSPGIRTDRMSRSGLGRIVFGTGIILVVAIIIASIGMIVLARRARR